MNGARKYAANTFWLFAERALQLVLGFTIGVWVVRYLGPLSFGAYSYALSVVGLCAPIATLGLDVILVRELFRHSGDERLWIGTAFYLRIITAMILVAFLTSLFILKPQAPEVRILILITSVTLLTAAFGVIDSYFQKHVASIFSVQAKVVSLLFSSVAKVVLILVHAPVVYFAVVLVAESILLCIGLIANFHRLGHHIRQWRWRPGIARQLITMGWPIWLTGIAIAAYLKVDQIMLQKWMGLDSVGQYGAAVRISEALYFIPMALTSTFYPALLNVKAQGEVIYRQRLQQFYDLMIWLGLFLALLLWIFGPELIKLLYGDQYSPAASVIRWHAPSLLFVFMAQAGSRWYLVENRQRSMLVMHLIGAGANLLLNYLFIPKWGIQGAALATVLSYGLASYGALVFWPAAWSNFRLLSTSFYLPGVVSRLRREYKIQKQDLFKG